MKQAISFMFIAWLLGCVHVYSDFVDSYVRQVCGGENKCSGGNQSSLPTDSCCRPCECEEVCSEKGTCCEDLTINIPKVVTKQLCMPSGRSYSFGEWYFVRAVCPGDYENETIRHQCEIADRPSLSDIAFVSSKDGKIIYKNRFCAACHGEEDVVTWDIIVNVNCIRVLFRDTDGAAASDASQIKEKLLNECPLPFLRPTITDPRYTMCHTENRLIRKCPLTQAIGNYSDQLEQSCLNDKSPFTVFHPVLPGRVFANVHCYMCQSRPVAGGHCAFVHAQKTPKTSLTFLLDTAPLQEAEALLGLSQLCNNSQIYDSYFDLCRDIVCPMLEVPVRGECKTLVASSRLNYNLDFQIDVTSPWRSGRRALFNFTTSLYDSFPSVIGFRDCLSCGAQVNMDKSRLSSNNTGIVSLFLRYIVTTTPKCERERVLSMAERFEERSRRHQYLNGTIDEVNISVKYIWSGKEYAHLIDMTENVFGQNMIDCKCLPANRFENCQKVILTRAEFYTLAYRTDIAGYQVAKNKQNDIEMCLDDYKQAITAITAITSNSKGLESHSLTLLTLLIVLLIHRFLMRG